MEAQATMQSIITLDVLAATSNEGFSLDELVYKTRELFEREGMAGFVGLILRLMDEKLCMDLKNGKDTAGLKDCCQNPHYKYHDRPERQIRTSAGLVKICWRRLLCTRCGETIIPLREFLQLDLYQSKSSELEKTVMEVVSEQSYRRSSKHLEAIGSIPVPKSTAHRWVAESDCDRIDTGEGTLDLLLADGTGYKRRPDKEKRINNRGELRIALGVDKEGSLKPLGAFSGKSWDDIADCIKGSREEDEPLAEVLISDGEPGLVENLVDLCKQHQRSHWHLVRDLNHRMWADGAPKDERDCRQEELAAIIGIELPEEDFDEVSEEDKENIIDVVEKARNDIYNLISTLKAKGYKAAASYVEKASRSLFSYIHRWLRTGIVTPRVSSLIERLMREIARRLKRIAFGWSEEGAAKMTRIIIKRFTSPREWEKYWKEKLRIEENVMLTLRSINAEPPQTLGR
jgi:hypothetical protein